MTMDFDQKAREWDKNPRNIDRTGAVAEAIRRHVPLETRRAVLEHGCGTGMLSFALRHELPGSITLIDTSDGMLAVLRDKIAAARAQNMRVEKCDLLVDALSGARFDLIYSAMALHHILDTRKILRLFADLLEVGGYLCIADLDREDGSFHEGEFDGHCGFERADLTMMLRDAGFGAVLYDDVFTIEKEVAGQRRRYPMFLVVAQKGEG